MTLSVPRPKSPVRRVRRPCSSMRSAVGSSTSVLRVISVRVVPMSSGTSAETPGATGVNGCCGKVTPSTPQSRVPGALEAGVQTIEKQVSENVQPMVYADDGYVRASAQAGAVLPGAGRGPDREPTAMEPDHDGTLAVVARRCPKIQLQTVCAFCWKSRMAPSSTCKIAATLRSERESS